MNETDNYLENIAVGYCLIMIQFNNSLIVYKGLKRHCCYHFRQLVEFDRLQREKMLLFEINKFCK